MSSCYKKIFFFMDKKKFITVGKTITTLPGIKWSAPYFKTFKIKKTDQNTTVVLMKKKKSLPAQNWSQLSSEIKKKTYRYYRKKNYITTVLLLHENL